MAGETKVGDYVALQRGTTYKGTLVGKPGPALLGLGSIRPGGGFRDGDYKTYGGDCPEKMMLFPGDLFVSLKGATKDGEMIGSIARVPPSVSSGRVTQDTVKLVFKNPDQEVIKYLYWLLRTPQYRDYCAGRATGSAVVALSREDFLAYPVPAITPRRIRIVEVLENVEHKIELNRCMNATLEAMARALFQSWFVDFDPVRAKLDGRQPAGFDPATAVLFPAAFEDSPLGPIPQGWEVRTADEVSMVGIGKTPPRKEHHWFSDSPSDIPWMSIRDLGDASVFISHTSECLTAEAVERFKVRRIPDDTVVLSFKLTIGRVAITDGEMLSNEAIAHFRLNSETPFSTAYLYCYLKGFGYDQLGSTSSIANAINSDMVRGIRILVPPRGLAEAFNRMVKPLFAQMKMLQRQSRILAALRDTLLPKLLSGELCVPDAMQRVEVVA